MRAPARARAAARAASCRLTISACRWCSPSSSLACTYTRQMELQNTANENKQASSSNIAPIAAKHGAEEKHRAEERLLLLAAARARGAAGACFAAITLIKLLTCR